MILLNIEIFKNNKLIYRFRELFECPPIIRLEETRAENEVSMKGGGCQVPM